MLWRAGERVVVRLVRVEKGSPRLGVGVRQSGLAMILQHGIPRGCSRIPDGIGRVHFVLSGEDECHTVVSVGVVDLNAQFVIRDSIREVSEDSL